ncbi:Rossmann-like domain-containing protein [Hydrogenophaga sp.]|uniref:Rossmann-like domain-containing protein n=1 Tax=Hydrogenophaga sp. TaxID=1904254 RepID=UPI003F6D54F6
MPTHTIAQSLLDQLTLLAQRFAPPRVAQLHVPQRPDTPGEHDAEFCAIELEDGAFGLSYVLLGDTLNALSASHGAGTRPLAGANPLALAQALPHGSAVQRALALAAINALTDSVWRQVGYEPPPAGNSLGDIRLTPQDHLGMIGFFPPLVRRVAEAGGRLSVVEMDQAMVARQRERYPDVHIGLDRAMLAPCNLVVGTSTMLLNDTLDDMLAAAPQATRFAVIGPSAGLWPDALFERGVTLLGGTQVVDAKGFREAMGLGESWSQATRKFAIARDTWPGWRGLTGL